MKASSPRLYFFVGTTAELIKVMPVMLACTRARLAFDIIASGQNDVRTSELLTFCGKSRPDVVLHEGPIRKSAAGLLAWFAKTFVRSIGRLRRLLRAHARGEAIVVVHGDTVSTVMGALLAKLHGARVAHVEAGLRSFDYLHPFPEEIDRVVTSRLTDIHFCPNAWAVSNLSRRSGAKVDTGHNTLLDALEIARREGAPSPTLQALAGRDFFIFVMHRQENLFDESLVRALVAKVVEQSRRDHCVFILHHLTEVALDKLGLLQAVEREPGITAVRRLPYIEFMQVLSAARYVVTDGGSNQEECFYLGKPCLVLRKVTERTEGLGENVVLSKLEPAVIDAFLADPMQHARPAVTAAESPSAVIVRTLRTALEAPA